MDSFESLFVSLFSKRIWLLFLISRDGLFVRIMLGEIMKWKSRSSLQNFYIFSLDLYPSSTLGILNGRLKNFTFVEVHGMFLTSESIQKWHFKILCQICSAYLSRRRLHFFHVFRMIIKHQPNDSTLRVRNWVVDFFLSYSCHKFWWVIFFWWPGTSKFVLENKKGIQLTVWLSFYWNSFYKFTFHI